MWGGMGVGVGVGFAWGSILAPSYTTLFVGFHGTANTFSLWLFIGDFICDRSLTVKLFVKKLIVINGVSTD